MFCSLPLDQYSTQKGDQRGKGNEQGIGRIPAHIKIIAGYQQPNDPKPMWNQVITKYHNGKKD
jgi:hypothetical protein